MESVTIFLASLWGPAILAMGVAVLISPGHYLRIYRELEREPLAMLVFGLIAMMFGAWHMQVHSLWDTLAEIIVSLLGVALLLKGAVLVIKPEMAKRWANMMMSSKHINLIGGICAILGAYLCWVGYLMY